MGKVIYVKGSLEVDFMEWNNNKWSEGNRTDEETKSSLRSSKYFETILILACT